MKATTQALLDKAKHFLYLFSIALLLFLCGLAFLHAPGNSTHMDFLSAFLSKGTLFALTLLGAVVLSFPILWLSRRLSALPLKRQKLILALTALACMAVQYTLLFTFRVTLRYDHLKVFDQALEIFRTGEISMTYGEGYFAQYPFNIPITLFNYGVMNLAKLLGIPETGYMLAIQCMYLFGTDLAVFFSYKILQLLRSQKTANLFALICFLNPLMYIYGFACYTTILMLPFLMGNLLLFIYMLREKNWKKKLFTPSFWASPL